MRAAIAVLNTTGPKMIKILSQNLLGGTEKNHRSRAWVEVRLGTLPPKF
jgi:hypothetical protein